MKALLKAKPRQIPLPRLALVASAGLVAFMEIMQGALTLTGQANCSVSRVSPDYTLALIEFSIAAVAYGVFLLGAVRLRRNWETGKIVYISTIVALLLNGGILSAMFLMSSSCVG